MNSISLFGSQINTAVVFQVQSTLILLLLFIGVYLRKQKLTHVKIMASAITWDILLILQIELNRGAIKKASEAMVNPMILNIHVTLAVASVLCYVFMVISGRKMLKGDQSKRSLHKTMGFVTLTLRTLTYITSYFAS